MTPPASDAGNSLEAMASRIRALRPSIEALIPKFRAAVARVEEAQDLRIRKYSGPFWVLAAYTDALVRLRLFLEQNFNYLESIGLLAVTRYVFELLVWLKLMQRDAGYGLAYYRDLLTKQRSYYSDLRNHLKCEVAFLRDVQAQEDRLLKQRADEAQRINEPEAKAERFERLWSEVTSSIDAQAARTFSLYAEQARTNGYGFQAHLVETKVLPGVEQSLAQLESELKAFDRDVPHEARSLIPSKWNWKDQAARAGMDAEYDFIYTYTSRLLHATPASLTTNQKNLETDEMRVFLNYIHIRLLDALDIATQFLEKGAA